MSFDQTAVERDLQGLAECCPLVARHLPEIGLPEARQRPHTLSTLLRIIVAQQLSTKAAATIWGRLAAAVGEEPDPQILLETGEDGLRALGLSRQKATYTLGLAQAACDGGLDMAAWSQLDDEEVIERITALKGFGRWSAEIYLMFALGRRDIWPADDLALQIGLQRLMSLDERPKTRKISAPLIEHWRPYRSAGSLFLWRFYGAATLSGQDDEVAPAKDEPAKAKPANTKPASAKPNKEPAAKSKSQARAKAKAGRPTKA